MTNMLQMTMTTATGPSTTMGTAEATTVTGRATTTTMEDQLQLLRQLLVEDLQLLLQLLLAGACSATRTTTATTTTMTHPQPLLQLLLLVETLQLPLLLLVQVSKTRCADAKLCCYTYTCADQISQDSKTFCQDWYLYYNCSKDFCSQDRCS